MRPEIGELLINRFIVGVIVLVAMLFSSAPVTHHRDVALRCHRHHSIDADAQRDCDTETQHNRVAYFALARDVDYDAFNPDLADLRFPVGLWQWTPHTQNPPRIRRNASRALIDIPQTSYYADDVVALAPLRVELADVNGVPIREGFSASVRVRHIDQLPGHYTSEYAEIAPLTEGTLDQTKAATPHKQWVVFDDLQFVRPIAGRHTLEVVVSEFNFTRHNMRYLVQIAVHPAKYPTKIAFTRRPSESFTPYGPFTQQPVVNLLDNAGNVVTRAEGRLRVSVAGPGYVVSPAYHIIEPEVPVVQGTAQWRALELQGATPGHIYHFNFTFIADDYGNRKLAYYEPRTVIHLQAARCNSSCVSPLCEVTPHRVITRTNVLSLRMIGWPYQQHYSNALLCRLASDPPLRGRVRLIDECNARCDVNITHVPLVSPEYSTRRFRVQVSLDAGETWSNLTRVVRETPQIENENATNIVSHDSNTEFARDPLTQHGALAILDEQPSGLGAYFHSLATRRTSNILIDPLGNTYLGNLSVEIVDRAGNPFRELDTGHWSVRIGSPPHTPLTGTLTVIASGGVAEFNDLHAPGFFEPGRNITLTVSATRIGEDFPRRVPDGRVAMVARGGTYLRTSTTFFLVNSLETRCEVPPVITLLESSSCRTQLGGSGLADCVSSSPITITVMGKGFGITGSTVRVGARDCESTQHDPSALLTRLIAVCRIPDASDAWSKAQGDNFVTTEDGAQLMVILRSSVHSGTSGFRVRPNAPVYVREVSGCPWNLPPSTGNCSSEVSTTITIRGSNFGTSSAEVALTSYYSSASFNCPGVAHVSGSADTIITCRLPPARGIAYLVSVKNAVTQQVGTAEHAAVTFSNRSAELCPKNEFGQLCSGKGVCNFAAQLCECFNTEADGFWTDQACGSCVADYWGERCTNVCPACIAGRGRCSEGTTGDGTCICVTGYGGATCEVICPGGVDNPCSGHGVCDRTGVCDCNNTEVTGFWAQPDCATCDPSFGGPNCDIPCPVDTITGDVCSGHGACNAEGACDCTGEFCGVLCNITGVLCTGCPTGVYGFDCDQECLGGRDNPCSGHGLCSDGPFGTGRCKCSPGYGSAACDVVCPPSASNTCSGHGTCIQTTGTCVCEVGWTLDDCGTECPGGVDNICSGHGQCDAATSTCTCDFGYAGAACNLNCSGGVTRPCNLNGVCVQADASCECYGDVDRGFWTGAACGTCQTDWWTATCDQQCEKVNGLQCNGKGSCDHSLTCTCFSGSTTGYWVGDVCNDCKAGFFGKECLRDCPGTACSPCNFHGNCSDGVNGTGICTCDSSPERGFWTGYTCNQCVGSYFGYDCKTRCPQGTGFASGTCGGRGACDDGTTGSGVCTCFGTFGGGSCSECIPGFWGRGCLNECPGGASNPCGGAGTCANTETSNGTCECQFGRVGSRCELACPTTNFGPCNSAGLCVLNDAGTAGICSNCSASPTTGYWQGVVCGECQAGYFGSRCRNICPGGIENTCSGHGICNDGVNGTGACNCLRGYAGVSCNLECANGPQLPCNDRGTCDSNTGACACDSTAETGFWSGTNCTECTANYAGSTCTTQCPLGGTNSTPCSSHGTCYEGVCIYCDDDYCGRTCSDLRASSSCNVCARGRYGTSCLECPGGSATPCSGHGVCSEGTFGSGRCYCDQGFLGVTCGDTCRGPPGIPCNGNGACNLVDGSCACRTGFAGEACEGLCNGFTNTAGSSPCNGVGTCDQLTGNCTCSLGYGGYSCEIECPGKVSNGAAIVPCNDRGTCTTMGTCDCTQDAVVGNWGGLACERCASGWFGTECKRPCVNGVSNAIFTGCVCNDGWYGAQCDQPCPGLLESAMPCYGQGNCTDGVDGDGSCSCEPDYYTYDCNVSCTRERCDSELSNGMCNNDGVCICRDDEEEHWVPSASGQCDTCNISYFGERCEVVCPCNGHGLCDRRTGSCTCYDSEEEGFWSGKLCEKCEDGFIGVRCQGRDVAVSRAGALSSAINNAYPPIAAGTLCKDPVYNYTYSGLEIISVFDRQHMLVRNFEVFGLAIGCHFVSPTQMFLFVYKNNTARYVIVDRETATFERNVNIDNVVNVPRVSTSQRAFVAEAAGGRLPTLGQVVYDNLADRAPGFAMALPEDIVEADDMDSIVGYLATLVAEDVSERQPPAGHATTSLGDSGAGDGLISTGRTVLQTSAVVTNSTARVVDAAAFLAHGVVDSIRLGVTTEAPFILAFERHADTIFQTGRLVVITTGVYRSFEVSTSLTRITAVCTGNESVVDGVWTGTFYVAGTRNRTRDDGSWFEQWEVVLIALSVSPTGAPSSNVVRGFADAYGAGVEETCGPDCRVRRIAAGTNGTVYAAMVSQSQAFIARFGVVYYETALHEPRQSSTDFCMRITLDSGSNSTSMVIDTYAVQGYVAFNPLGNPSTCFKFDLPTCTVSGQAQLSIVGSDREVVLAMRLDDRYRLLQLYAPLSLLHRTVELTTFAVVKPVPEFVDTQGSTTVTVRGTGFIDGIYCMFGTADRRVRATVLNRDNLLCSSPSGGSEACSGELLELAISTPASWMTTNNKKTVRRMTTPIVRSIRSNETGGPFGYIVGGTVFVRGVGLAECIGCEQSLLRCKVYSPRLTTPPIIVRATPVSSNEISCPIPAVSAPLPIPTYLEVSVDGTVFSSSLRTYSTYGVDYAILVTQPALPEGVVLDTTVIDPASDVSRFTIKSAQSARLPSVVVDVTDAELHSLGRFATSVGTHTIHCSIFGVRVATAEGSLGEFQVLTTREYTNVNDSTIEVPGVTIPVTGYPGANQSASGNFSTHALLPVDTRSVSVGEFGEADIELHGTLTLSDGNAASVTFSDLTLENAPVGTLTIRFFDSQHYWTTYMTLTVTEGEPFRLVFERRASTTTRNNQPTLGTQPIIAVADRSGNRLSTFAGKEFTITTLDVSYSYHLVGGLPSSVALKVAPAGNLFRVEGISMTGRRGLQYFINFTIPGLDFPTLLSDPITVENCPVNFYGRFDDTDCYECPTQGICDGSLVIRAKDNWWRADNTTLNFYYCGAPNSGDSCYNDSSCRDGYRGPICSVCEEGFGRAGIDCIKCIPANAVLIAVLAAVVIGVFVILVFTVMTGTARNLMAAAFRNMVTHMQILSRLGELQIEWPSLLTTLWEVMNKVQIEPTGISPVDCAAGDISYFEKYVGVMISPWALVIVVAPIAWIVVQIKQREQDKPIEEAVERTVAAIEEGDETEVLYESALMDWEAKNLAAMEAKRRKKKGKKRHHIKDKSQTATGTHTGTHTHTDDTSSANGDEQSSEASSEEEASTTEATNSKLVSDEHSATDSQSHTQSHTSHVGTSSRLPNVLSRKSKSTLSASQLGTHKSHTAATHSGTGGNESDEPSGRTGRRKKRRDAAPDREVALRPLMYVMKVLEQRKKRVTFVSTLIVTALVVFTLVYPTLVQSSGIILRCDPIDMGEEGVRELFVRDRRVDCNSDQYQLFYKIAISVLVAYGFLVPAGVIGTVILVRNFGGHLTARTLLSFLLHGFKPDLWFWETTNLLRKFAVMLIVVFVKDPKLQVILFMWCVVASFMMHLVFRPYVDDTMHRVEAVGQSCMVITLNLVLLLFMPSVEGSDWQPFALSVIVLIINVIAILAYVGVIGYYLMDSVKQYFARRKAIAANDGKHPAVVALDSAIDRLHAARNEREGLGEELVRLRAAKLAQLGDGLEGSMAGLQTDITGMSSDEDASDLIDVVDPGKTLKKDGTFGGFVAFGRDETTDAGLREATDEWSVASSKDIDAATPSDQRSDDDGAARAQPSRRPHDSQASTQFLSSRDKKAFRRSVTFQAGPAEVSPLQPVKRSHSGPGFGPAEDGLDDNGVAGGDTDAEFMFNLPDEAEFSPIVDASGAPDLRLPTDHEMRRARRGVEAADDAVPADKELLRKAFGVDSDDDDDDGSGVASKHDVAPVSESKTRKSLEPTALTVASLRTHTQAEEERAAFDTDGGDSDDTDDLLAAVVGGRKHVHPSAARAQRAMALWDTQHGAAPSPIPSADHESDFDVRSEGSFNSRPPSQLDDMLGDKKPGAVMTPPTAQEELAFGLSASGRKEELAAQPLPDDLGGFGEVDEPLPTFVQPTGHSDPLRAGTPEAAGAAGDGMAPLDIGALMGNTEPNVVAGTDRDLLARLAAAKPRRAAHKARSRTRRPGRAPAALDPAASQADCVQPTTPPPEHPDLRVDVTLEDPAAQPLAGGVNPLGVSDFDTVAGSAPLRESRGGARHGTRRHEHDHKAPAKLSGLLQSLQDSSALFDPSGTRVALPDDTAAETPGAVPQWGDSVQLDDKPFAMSDLLRRFDEDVGTGDEAASPEPVPADHVAPHVGSGRRRSSGFPGRGDGKPQQPRNPLDPESGFLSESSTSRGHESDNSLTPAKPRRTVRASEAPSAATGGRDDSAFNDPSSELAGMQFDFAAVDLGRGLGSATDDPFGFPSSSLPAAPAATAAGGTSASADPSDALRDIDFAAIAGVPPPARETQTPDQPSKPEPADTVPVVAAPSALKGRRRASASMTTSSTLPTTSSSVPRVEISAAATLSTDPSSLTARTGTTSGTSASVSGGVGELQHFVEMPGDHASFEQSALVPSMRRDGPLSPEQSFTASQAPPGGQRQGRRRITFADVDGDSAAVASPPESPRGGVPAAWATGPLQPDSSTSASRSSVFKGSSSTATATASTSQESQQPKRVRRRGTTTDTTPPRPPQAAGAVASISALSETPGATTATSRARRSASMGNLNTSEKQKGKALTPRVERPAPATAGAPAEPQLTPRPGGKRSEARAEAAQRRTDRRRQRTTAMGLSKPSSSAPDFGDFDDDPAL